MARWGSMVVKLWGVNRAASHFDKTGAHIREVSCQGKILVFDRNNFVKSSQLTDFWSRVGQTVQCCRLSTWRLYAPRVCGQWGDSAMDGWRRTFPTSPISGSRGILKDLCIDKQEDPQKNTMTRFTESLQVLVSRVFDKKHFLPCQIGRRWYPACYYMPFWDADTSNSSGFNRKILYSGSGISLSAKIFHWIWISGVIA